MRVCILLVTVLIFLLAGVESVDQAELWRRQDSMRQRIIQATDDRKCEYLEIDFSPPGYVFPEGKSAADVVAVKACVVTEVQ